MSFVPPCRPSTFDALFAPRVRLGRYPVSRDCKHEKPDRRWFLSRSVSQRAARVEWCPACQRPPLHHRVLRFTQLRLCAHTERERGDQVRRCKRACMHTCIRRGGCGRGVRAPLTHDWGVRLHQPWVGCRMGLWSWCRDLHPGWVTQLGTNCSAGGNPGSSVALVSRPGETGRRVGKARHFCARFRIRNTVPVKIWPAGFSMGHGRAPVCVLYPASPDAANAR